MPLPSFLYTSQRLLEHVGHGSQSRLFYATPAPDGKQSPKEQIQRETLHRLDV